MDPLQASQASQSKPKRKRKKPEKPEKVKKLKIEDVSDLLAQWPSPGKVIFELLQIKGQLSPQPILLLV
jgi:hypothetical protein